MNIQSNGHSDVGKCRKNNEDAFLVDDSLRLYAVADGLGGLDAGEEASAIAVSVLREQAEAASGTSAQLDLVFAVSEAHRSVCGLNDKLGPGKASGSTLTALMLLQESCLVAHVGDSALFRFRPDAWEKLTTDHTEAEELRRRHPGTRVPERFEHTLTRCLGQPGKMRIDHHHYPVSPGERLLLCTDGLTRHISPEELHQEIFTTNDPAIFLQKMIHLSNERGGADNATGVALFLF